MHSIEELPGRKGANPDIYYSSLYVFGPLSSHMLAPGAGGTGSANSTSKANGGKRRRVNYNVRAIQAAQFMRENPADEDKAEEGAESEEQRLLNAVQLKKAAKRFDELNRENYNDSVKIEVPKNITQLHTMKSPKRSITVRRILNSKKTWSNFQDELDKKELRHLRRLEARPTVSRTKKLCTICGNISWSSCTKCGERVCTAKCMAIHKETRCTNF